MGEIWSFGWLVSLVSGPKILQGQRSSKQQGNNGYSRRYSQQLWVSFQHERTQRGVSIDQEPWFLVGSNYGNTLKRSQTYGLTRMYSNGKDHQHNKKLSGMCHGQILEIRRRVANDIYTTGPATGSKKVETP